MLKTKLIWLINTYHMFYKHKCSFVILRNESWIQKYAINTKYLLTSSICDDALAVPNCQEVKH